MPRIKFDFKNLSSYYAQLISRIFSLFSLNIRIFILNGKFQESLRTLFETHKKQEWKYRYTQKQNRKHMISNHKYINIIKHTVKYSIYYQEAPMAHKHVSQSPQDQ